MDIASCSAVDGLLVESQEGLETEVGPRADLTSQLRSKPSCREIVPKREPIPVIHLLDDESVEGPKMAPVAPGIRLGTSIEEDPSEPTSDSKMTPEPERVAPVAAGDTGTFVADSLPVAASPTPILPVESISLFPELSSLLRGVVREHDIHGYCLWRISTGNGEGRYARSRARRFIAQFIGTTRDSMDRACDELESRPRCSSSQCPQAENMSSSQSPNHADKAVSESCQNRQSEPIREATPGPEQATHKVIENFMIKMTELLETSMATRRNERVPATGADEALELFLKFRPPEFYGEVEQEIKVELFLEQLNAATPYKRPGQGPWKPRDFKRPCGEQRTGNEGRPTLTPGGAHRVFTYCGRSGHVPEMCYQKLRLCYRYGKPGHVRDQCLEMQQVPPEMSRRAGRPPIMRGAMEGRNNKPQVKAKVYASDGLPVDTEVEVVEVFQGK
ncbi:hypothetical protein M9H77_12816 [Catharanthus roseus]|uniref:Uncharacterized protein n=1 Tax=Catharanthus roseus TaxID=4058 RepID=A0ACC0BIJ4_CATRO|nr:hypothetical protein M9H77_12816 [Catharanthus roseus]